MLRSDRTLKKGRTVGLEKCPCYRSDEARGYVGVVEEGPPERCWAAGGRQQDSSRTGVESCVWFRFSD